MLRAFKEIQIGEEITTAYRNLSVADRREQLATLDFECKCRLCHFEASEDPKLTKKVQESLNFIERKLDKFAKD